MEEVLRISTFGDAVAEAFALAEQFRRAHTAVLVDDDDVIVDMTVFAAAHHTSRAALEWASCALINDDRIARMVLISVVSDGVREPREDDIAAQPGAQHVRGERLSPPRPPSVRRRQHAIACVHDGGRDVG